MILAIAIISLLASSCTKEDASLYNRVVLEVGESHVVELGHDENVFADGVRLFYDDSRVCEISDINANKVTVTALQRGIDILHIEYATKRTPSGYSCVEMLIEVK